MQATQHSQAQSRRNMDSNVEYEGGFEPEKHTTRGNTKHAIPELCGHMHLVASTNAAPGHDRATVRLDPGGGPLQRRPTGGSGLKHGELVIHDHVCGHHKIPQTNDGSEGNNDSDIRILEPGSDTEDNNDLGQGEEEIDPDTAEQNQKQVLKLFDTSWQPLALDEPDWYEKVTTFIEQGINPETTDELGLNLAGPDGKTFLFLILTVAAPKLKRQVQASRITFQQRRDLFRWLMCKYPTLYRDGAEHLGYSIFEMVIQRAERIHKDVRENDRLFIEFFMTNYPEQASTLLNADAAKEGAKGIPLVHQLLPMMKAKKSLGSLSLLHHLDKLTILQRDQSGNTVFHLAVAYNFMCDEGTPSQNQLLKGIQSMLERCEDALRCTNRQGQSPYQYRVDTYGQMRLANSVEKGLPLADDPIAQYLKDRYMHFEKRDEIIKYLHGVVQEYEIHVNLQELSEINVALTRADLEGLIENLKLENILQCVRIPKYQLTATPQTKTITTRGKYSMKAVSGTAAGDPDQQGSGRRDYEQIFDLLGKKGVRKVIKIKVMDDEQNPHSDEVLEKLRQFDIEEWDWDRTDICSEILAQAAPNLRKVTLYSSGNNAVLRSWSSIDGLNQLEKLEEVNVVIYQRLESMARVQNYKQAFLNRMEENKPPHRVIKVSAEIKRDGRGTGIVRHATVDGEARTTQWLKTMDKFARFIVNIPQEALPQEAVGVKVALLDDGIDGLHGGFGRETLKDGISFLNHDDNVLPFCFSSIGHGTRMATLIRSMCPHVQLYVVRLDQYPSIDGSQMQPTPESAALGIQWAIRKKVDIISMSWTIAKTENNKPGMAQLERALQEARKANILMFGASSDQGWNEENPGLPSGFPGVFCIGAAKSSGKAEDQSEKEARYVFPGSAGNSDLRASIAQRQGDLQVTPLEAAPTPNSSSFATALAAGLAALILYCVDLTEILDLQETRMLRKFEVMRDILDRMCSDNKKYIAVKKYFDPKLASMSWDYDSATKLREKIKVIIRPFTDNKTKFL